MGNVVKTNKQQITRLKSEDENTRKNSESSKSRTSCQNTNQNNIEANMQQVEIKTNITEIPFETKHHEGNLVKKKGKSQPYFFVGLEDIIAPEGNTIPLECCIHCFPPGEISWYKDNFLIQHGTNGYILEKEESGWNRLIIPAARFV